MPSPWEQTWNDVKQGVEQAVGNASEAVQKALPWAQDWKAKATPQQAPAPPAEAVKPSSGEITAESLLPALIQAESRGVHIDEKTGELLKSKRGALGLTQIKPDTAKAPGYGIKPLQDHSPEEYKRFTIDMLKAGYKKFGDWEKTIAGYNAGFGTIDKAIGKAERFGGNWQDHLPQPKETLPYIRKILPASSMKPVSSPKGKPLAATEVGTILDDASAFAKAAGEGVQDLALAAGAGVGTSSALATAGEMLADPLNLVPGGKGIAAAGVIKVGGKKITETMTDATFASILHSITGNTEDIAKVIKGKKLSADEREQLLLEALLAKKKGK
jgi:hypothetical protein